MRVTANHAETEQNRLDRSASIAAKRPQWAEFDAAAALGPPKAGQWRDSSRNPARKTLEPQAALGNYALKPHATWGMSVEGLVGFARRNFMVPIPRFATWELMFGMCRLECE